MEGSIAERVASLINGLWDLGHAVGDFFFGGGTYPLLRSGRLLVPLLQRLTFEQRKSKQNALAPPLGTSPRLGVPSLRLWTVGRRDGPSLAQRG
jgi:hypothetical protein